MKEGHMEWGAVEHAAPHSPCCLCSLFVELKCVQVTMWCNSACNGV